MNTCRSCGASVRWALTNNGKRTLLDAECSDQGNTVLLMVPVAGDPVSIAVVLGGEVLEKARDGGATLRTSHFATCPNADQHRKKAA